MTGVTRRPDESPDDLVKRFQTSVQRSGVLRQLREKRFFVTKGENRRRKKAKALRRFRRKSVRRSDR